MNNQEKAYKPVNSIIRQLTAGKNALELQDNRSKTVMQQKVNELAVQKKANNTGLPGNLKSGIENLSGYSMDDVKVHYNSNKPAQLQALAYAQGSNIHIGPGQEKHLPHEAWHVVQQKQGRVKPTMQTKGVNINDNTKLEDEADRMGKYSVSKFSGNKTTGTDAEAMLYHSGNNNAITLQDNRPRSVTQPIQLMSATLRVKSRKLDVNNTEIKSLTISGRPKKGLAKIKKHPNDEEIKYGGGGKYVDRHQIPFEYLEKDEGTKVVGETIAQAATNVGAKKATLGAIENKIVENITNNNAKEGTRRYGGEKGNIEHTIASNVFQGELNNATSQKQKEEADIANSFNLYDNNAYTKNPDTDLEHFRNVKRFVELDNKINRKRRANVDLLEIDHLLETPPHVTNYAKKYKIDSFGHGETKNKYGHMKGFNINEKMFDKYGSFIPPKPPAPAKKKTPKKKKAKKKKGF